MATVFRRSWQLPLLCGLMLLSGGCGRGQDWARVSGHVSYDGEPVEQGTITLYPKQGQVAGASIINGTYSISTAPGAAIGVNRVEITWRRKTGKQVPAGSPAPPGTLIDETIETIPARYHSASELTVTLTSGHNVCDFVLAK